MTDDPPPGSGKAVPSTRLSTDPVGRVPGGLVDNVTLSAAQVDAHTRQNVARHCIVSWLFRKARNWPNNPADEYNSARAKSFWTLLISCRKISLQTCLNQPLAIKHICSC